MRGTSGMLDKIRKLKIDLAKKERRAAILLIYSSAMTFVSAVLFVILILSLLGK